jgi:hypothetical protein
MGQSATLSAASAAGQRLGYCGTHLSSHTGNFPIKAGSLFSSPSSAGTGGLDRGGVAGSQLAAGAEYA